MSSTAVSHGTRRWLYTAVALLVVVVVVAGVLGFGNLLALFVGAIQLALGGLTLYLFYRFVLAVERIARALERSEDEPEWGEQD